MVVILERPEVFALPLSLLALTAILFLRDWMKEPRP